MARSVLLTIVLVVSVPALRAQEPPPARPVPSTPAAPAAPAARAGGEPAAPLPALSFASDAGLVIFTVKAQGAADFEALFARIKEGLARGEKPEYQAMAQAWTLFRVADMTQAGQVLYACVIDPAVKLVDYDPVKLLGELVPAEAAALYPKIKDAIVSVNRLNLTTVLKMGQ